MGKNILIVDDEKDFLDLCSIRLKKAGYDIFSADSAEDAIHFLKKMIPDLILLDLRLPGMQGDEFCRKVKTNVKTRSIVIILFSAAGCDLSEKQKECQADDFISKPFDASELLDKIKKFI
jgi:DNA-binding response OmpR family regulator